MAWVGSDGKMHEQDDEDEEQEKIVNHLLTDDEFEQVCSGSEYDVQFNPDFDLSEQGLHDSTDEEPQEQPDLINPEYYQQGTMECIDAIEGLNLLFHEAQILKYIVRWRKKGGFTDLKKAKWYLDRLINKETTCE